MILRSSIGIIDQSPRKFEVKLAGNRVVARLLERDAPNSCGVFWSLLPFEGKAAHCLSSGTCIYISHETSGVTIPIIDPENESPFVSQGDIVYSQRGEIIIVYGKRCYLRSMSKDTEPMNHIAEIDICDDKYQNFENAAAETNFKGLAKISFRRLR